MKLQETLNFKLAKLLLALAWSDGKIDNSELNVVKTILFKISKVSSREWQMLEMYIENPATENELEFLLQDVLDSINTAAERDEVLKQLELLVAADGKISDAEKVMLNELETAIKAKATGICGIFQKISSIFKTNSLKHDIREDQFEDYIHNKVLYDFKRLYPEEAEKMTDNRLKKICAAAALLGRIGGFDKEFTETEFIAVVGILHEDWGLSVAEARLLADVTSKRTIEDFNYAHLIHVLYQTTSYEERKKFIISLFKIANASDHVSYGELNQIKALSACLKISHPDFIEAKLTIPREHRNGF